MSHAPIVQRLEVVLLPVELSQLPRSSTGTGFLNCVEIADQRHVEPPAIVGPFPRSLTDAKPEGFFQAVVQHGPRKQPPIVRSRPGDPRHVATHALEFRRDFC